MPPVTPPMWTALMWSGARGSAPGSADCCRLSPATLGGGLGAHTAGRWGTGAQVSPPAGYGIAPQKTATGWPKTKRQQVCLTPHWGPPSRGLVSAGAGRLLLCALPRSLAAPPGRPRRGPEPLGSPRRRGPRPQVAVDAAGHPRLAPPALGRRHAPARHRAPLDALPRPAPRRGPPFHLSPGPAPYVAWPQPVSGSTALYVADLATGEAAPHLLAARPPAWTYAVDASGRPHAAWAEGNAVYYWVQGQPAVLAARTTSAARVSDVSLALTPAGEAYLSWTGWNAADRPTGLYVGDPRGERPVVLAVAFSSADAAPGALGSRLLALGEEDLLLAWLEADGLRVATSADWRAATLVAPGVTGWGGGPRRADAVRRADASPGRGPPKHAPRRMTRRALAAHSGDGSPAAGVSPPGRGSTGLDLAVGPGGAPPRLAAGEGAAAEVYTLRVEPPAPASSPRPRAGRGGPGPHRPRRHGAPPRARWVEVAFWAEEAPGGLLHPLGVDRDPADGWSAHVDGLPLAAPATLRVLALGTDAAGRVRRAAGDWFPYAPAGAPRVWLDVPPDIPLRGEATVGVLPAQAGAGPIALAIEGEAGEVLAVPLGEVLPPPAGEEAPRSGSGCPSTRASPTARSWSPSPAPPPGGCRAGDPPWKTPWPHRPRAGLPERCSAARSPYAPRPRTSQPGGASSSTFPARPLRPRRLPAGRLSRPVAERLWLGATQTAPTAGRRGGPSTPHRRRRLTAGGGLR